MSRPAPPRPRHPLGVASAFRLPAPARGPSAAEDPAPPRSLLTSARITRAPPA